MRIIFQKPLKCGHIVVVKLMLYIQNDIIIDCCLCACEILLHDISIYAYCFSL